MTRKRIHEKFDQILLEKGIISKSTYGNSVHSKIDSDPNHFGPYRSVADPSQTIKHIRAWINSWSHLGSQTTKTDYIRIALGHIVIDDIKSRKEYSDEGDLLRRALISFKKKGFHRTYYKEP